MQLSIGAVFTSLVFIATVIFSIYVPLTQGFFNIGESMVYATALLFGPLVGGFAGGVGAALAD
ncbi:MAG: ECF transporter S component, partial [Candidatus Bathyarchaeota archaeon]